MCRGWVGGGVVVVSDGRWECAKSVFLFFRLEELHGWSVDCAGI
jgi:hypothetical protein